MADFSLSPYLESHVMELFLQMKIIIIIIIIIIIGR